MHIVPHVGWYVVQDIAVRVFTRFRRSSHKLQISFSMQRAQQSIRCGAATVQRCVKTNIPCQRTLLATNPSVPRLCYVSDVFRSTLYLCRMPMQRLLSSVQLSRNALDGSELMNLHWNTCIPLNLWPCPCNSR